MKLIILLIFTIVIYALGYCNGFEQCEKITEKAILNVIKECEEKKMHKFKEASNTDD